MGKPFKALFEDLQAGREVCQAQETLYRLASVALLEPLRGRIPARVRGRLDAEDVLHEAIFRALNNIAQAKCATERQFLAWVYTIARNLITDQARRMSAAAVPFARASRAGKNSTSLRISTIAAPEKSAESNFARRETIDKALSQLREQEAEVIRRRWFSGQSITEIARALRRTPKAVKGLYTRAWKRFQQIADSVEP